MLHLTHSITWSFVLRTQYNTPLHTGSPLGRLTQQMFVFAKTPHSHPPTLLWMGI